MLLNELAQWAVIAFLCVFVLGLTRQLGNYLVPAREMLANDNGPRLGKLLPVDLVDAHARERLMTLMEQRQTPWAVVAVVTENCSGCESLTDRLRRPVTRSEHPPIVVLSRHCSPEYSALLEDLADLVVIDGAHLDAANLRVSPFLMIIDDSLAVVHKEVTANLDGALSRWRDRNAGTRPAAADPEHAIAHGASRTLEVPPYLGGE